MTGKPDISKLAEKIKEFPIEITGGKSYEQAQVCSGGVLFLRGLFGHFGIQEGAGAVSGRRDSGYRRYLWRLQSAVGLDYRSPGREKRCSEYQKNFTGGVELMLTLQQIKLPVSHTREDLRKKY